MPRELRLQDPGEGIHEAEIVDLAVGEGDRVEDGQVLVTVETDKAAVEIPSPFTGTVEEIRVEVGERIEVGDVLLTYTPEGEAEEPSEEVEEPSGEAEKEETTAGGGKGAGEEQEEGEARTEGGEERKRAHSPDRPVPAAPSTRRRARELGVDLHAVPGSGPGGRVTREDVEAFAERGAEEEEAPKRAAPKAAPEVGASAAEEEEAGLPDFSHWGEVERVPFRSVRRTTAERMSRSWRRIPHVTHMDAADVTDLERVRRHHAAEVEKAGGRLTLTAFVMKAAVSALKEFPRFNASLDAEAGEIVLKKHYHLGVAVDTERGLVVPVIRDVDRKSVARLAVELTELAERTREGSTKPREMRGATFTITNPGPIGGTAFTPLVNWPQVAILGMARARLQPTVIGDLDEHEIVARLHLPLCLAFDHRVNDGAGAARFLRHVTETLGDTESFLLDA